MASIPIPTSPHLYPQVNTSRPGPPTGLVEEALVRSADGAKKLLHAWSRPGADIPDARTPLPRTRSDIDMLASAMGDNMSSSSSSSEFPQRSSSRASKQAAGDRTPNFTRSLLHKSSRLLQRRKSTPKLRHAPNVSVWEDDEPMPLSFSHLLHKSQSHLAAPVIRKESISEPFNFQHITHTNNAHAKTLKDAQPTNLVTEFCAMRAAQKPRRELKGIRAEDLPSGTQSEVASLAPSSTASNLRISPAASRPTTPGRERSLLKTSKSMDNFRLANPRSFSAPIGVVVPPPRKSSRKPVNLARVFIDTVAPPALDSPTLPTPVTASTIRSPDFSQYEESLLTPTTEFSNNSPIEIAQAVTTPDDTACPVSSKSLDRNSVAPTTEVDATKVPERSSSGSLRHSKSMPTVKHFSRIWNSSTSLASAGDVPPSPERKTADLPQRSSSRYSMEPKVLNENWEDSVDYCYDFAMDENDADGSLTMSAGRDHTTPIGASTPAMTDSAYSSEVSFHSTNTPSYPMPSPGLVDVPRDTEGATLFQLSPSLLVPREYGSRVTHEEQYGQTLADLETKHAFSNYFYPPLESDVAMSGSRGSPRSSRTPLSKSSSHDSFGSRGHQANISGGSTPSLVRGKASREQLATYSAAAELNVALSSGGGTITDAIDSMRRDLIRAAEGIPTAHFAAMTTSTPSSRLAVRTACPSPEDDAPYQAQAAVNPRYAVDKAEQQPSAAMQHQIKRRQRASSAAHAPSSRALGHRTSYSLFPGQPRA